MARKKTDPPPPTEASPPQNPEPVQAIAPAVPVSDTNGRPPDPPVDGGGGRRPTFKVGPIATSKDNAVVACVWENEVAAGNGQTFKVHNVTVESRYWDQSGEWKSGKCFRGSQLHVLLYCLQKCADFIFAARDPHSDIPF